MNKPTYADQDTLSQEQEGAQFRRDQGQDAALSVGSARDLPRPAPRKMVAKRAPWPSWAVGASALWVSMALTYIVIAGGVSPTPVAIAGVIAGFSAPLIVVWLVALLEMRAWEVDTLTMPVRRQLAALLAPGAAADARVRRVTQALAEQADQLRHAASVALEDSSAAMNALTRQSGELRRMSFDAMGELNKIGQSAEQTLQNLQMILGQVNSHSGTQREKALDMASELEAHIREVLQQVDRLSSDYESKLARLDETSSKLEERTKSIINLKNDTDLQIDQAADVALNDISRLESAVAELGQRSAAIAHQLARPVESLETAARHLDTNMRQSQEMLIQATQSLEKIGDNALGRASSLVSTLSDRLSSMELIGAKIVSVGATAQAETGRYVAQIEAVAERIRSQNDQGQQHLKMALQEFASVSSKAMDQSSAMVDRIHQGADRLTEVLEHSEEKFDALAWDIENRATRLHEVGKTARAELEEARLLLDTAQDTFNLQLDRMNNLSSSLQQEISRADEGAARLISAQETVSTGAGELISASEKTRTMLTSVAELLVGQQSGVEAMATALNRQIETLTANLNLQQDAIREAASKAASDGENTRAVLREQVQAIAAATVETAAHLDVLNNRFTAESSALQDAASQAEARLLQVVESVHREVESTGQVTRLFGTQQQSLTEIAAKAQSSFTELHAQLKASQQVAVQAMDSVANRLAALNSEIVTADQALQQTASTVSEKHESLVTDNKTLLDGLALTLSQLDAMQQGLSSAGDVVSSQGSAATDLLTTARQQIIEAGAALAQEAAAGQKNIFDTAEGLTAQLAEMHALESRITSLTAGLNDTLSAIERGDKLVGQVGEGARATLDSVKDQLNAAAANLQARSEKGIGHLQAYVGEMDSTSSQFIARTDAVDVRLRRLQEDMEALQHVIGQLSERSDVLAVNLANHANEADAATGKLQGANHVAVQATAQLLARMEEIGTTAQRQQTALMQMAEALRTADRELEKTGQSGQVEVQSALATLQTASASAGEELQAVVNRLGEARSKLVDVESKMSSTSSFFIEQVQLADAATDMNSARIESFGRKVEAVGAMARTTSADLEKQESALEQLHSRLAAQAEGLEGVSSRMQGLSKEAEAAVGQVSAQAATLGESATQQRQKFEELTTSLSAAQATMQRESNESITTLQRLLNEISESGDQSDRMLLETVERLQTAGSVVGAEGTRAQTLLAGLTESLRDAAADFMERMSAAEVSALSHRREMEALGASAHEQIEALGARTKQTAETFGESEARLSALQDRLGEQAQAIGKTTEEILEMQEATKAQQQQMLALHTQIHSGEERTAALLESLMVAGARADTTLSDMLTRLEAAGGALDTRSTSASDLLAEFTAALRVTAEELSTHAKAAEAALSQSRSQLQAVADDVSAQSDKTTTQLEYLSSQSRSTQRDLEDTEGRLSGLQQQIIEAVEDLVQEMTRLGTVSTGQATRLQGLNKAVAENVMSLETVGRAATSQQEALLSTVEKADATVKSLAEGLTDIRTQISDLADHASDRLTTVNRLIGESGEGAMSRTTQLEQIALAMEEKLALAATVATSKQSEITSMADKAMDRLAQMGQRFEIVKDQAHEAHLKLMDDGAQNERLIGGLSQIAISSSEAIQEATQRMAMLTHQATQDSTRLADVATRLEQQHNAIRHTADAAMAVMQSVEAQLHRSGEASVSLIDAAEGRVSDVLVAMTERLEALSRQSDAMMSELRSTVARYEDAVDSMRQSGQQLGTEISASSELLHSRARDLTAAGQQFDEELRARTSSLQSTQQGLQQYFTGFGQNLAQIDTQTSGYLIDLERRSQESFSRLQQGVHEFAQLPAQMDSAQAQLGQYVQHARDEMASLRQSLTELGAQIKQEMTEAGSTGTSLLAQMQDVGAQSRQTAEQLETVSQQLSSAAERAWQTVGEVARESTEGLAQMGDRLEQAEVRAGQVAYLARTQLESMLERMQNLGEVVDTSLTRLQGRCEALADGATRLESTAEVASTRLEATTGALDERQASIEKISGSLQLQIGDIRQQIEALLAQMGGLDARLEYVGPVVGGQQEKLESFLVAVDRTLNQVTSLQSKSRDLAAEHLDLATLLQESEDQLLASSQALDERLVNLDKSTSRDILSRLNAAAEQAAKVEHCLGSLDERTDKIDASLQSVRNSLAIDVEAMARAQAGIEHIAGRATHQITSLSTALEGAMLQLQKSGQLSQAGMAQTHEETQRLVLRFEQVRTMIKNMMVAVGSDLDNWQVELKKKIEAYVAEASAQRAAIPALPGSLTRARPAVAPAPAGTTGSTSTQLTTEALHALAVDLYRLLHAEVPSLKKGITPPAARRQPMMPDEARAFTKALLEQASGEMASSVRDLYKRNFEFRQYVDRFTARFEAQYDVMVRAPQGLAEAKAFRESEVGALYEMMARALQRRHASLETGVAG